MARQRLSPEEREARRRERIRHSFSNAAYQHYDTKAEGFGSAEEWIRTAEAAAGGGHGDFRFDTGRVDGTRSTPQQNRDLAALGITVMPGSLAELKAAFRKRMFAVHPDHGGTKEATIAAMDAFNRLKEVF